MNLHVFALAFLFGRAGSVLLYQATWNSGAERRFHPAGALATFLARPWPWIAHLPILALSAGLDWQAMPGLHMYVWLVSGALALGSVGRWGAVDLGRLFVFDRLLIVALWLGVWVTPALLYPLLIAVCCLQYTVSGWALSPGYSNLLGFEFMRSSACMALAGMLLRLPASQALALVLCGQAAGYVAQAVAKSALGPHPFAWILENRLQCLIVNAWLRGWGTGFVGREGILRCARAIGRIRVPLCGAAWLIEIGWIAILSDRRLAIAILAATAMFHLAVWLLTGLAGYHYLLSHIAMIMIVGRTFPPGIAWVGTGCILAASLWTLLLRRRLFRALARGGAPGPWGRAFDPADHLMAWWDGPYMRMYSYSVKTASGRRYHFPVTRFSPYDTFLTDIHTHLMILGRDWEADPYLAADRAFARAGVWGLLVSPEERDRIQGMGNAPEAVSPRAEDRAEAGAEMGEASAPLRAFFAGLNRYQGKWWFRMLWRWPHFPGEDHVPDWSPLAAGDLPAWRAGEPVAEVTCHCVKTFYRGDSIRVEERIFGRFPVGVP